LIALVPSIFMGHVSELYLMGPNLGMAVWFGVSVTHGSGKRRAPEAVRRTCLVLVGLIGVVGIASRADHFRTTWIYARSLHGQLQSRLALAHPSPVQFTLDPSCLAGANYSVYIVSPARALNLAETKRLLGAATPVPQTSSPIDVPLTCTDLPGRSHW
jgi:hypothetical protein